MGEYAVDQMMKDFKRMTGIDADREEFEERPRPPKVAHRCKVCNKSFKTGLACRDHIRDKHKPPASG